MVFGDLTFSIGIKYNKKQLEASVLFQSSSSVPTCYLNNLNLLEEIYFYLSDEILLDQKYYPSAWQCVRFSFGKQQGHCAKTRKSCISSNHMFVVQK